SGRFHIVGCRSSRLSVRDQVWASRLRRPSACNASTSWPCRVSRRTLEPFVTELAKASFPASRPSPSASGGSMFSIEFFPVSSLRPPASATQLTNDNVQIQIDFYLNGPSRQCLRRRSGRLGHRAHPDLLPWPLHPAPARAHLSTHGRAGKGAEPVGAVAQDA